MQVGTLRALHRGALYLAACLPRADFSRRGIRPPRSRLRVQQGRRHPPYPPRPPFCLFGPPTHRCAAVYSPRQPAATHAQLSPMLCPCMHRGMHVVLCRHIPAPAPPPAPAASLPPQLPLALPAPRPSPSSSRVRIKIRFAPVACSSAPAFLTCVRECA